MSGLLCSTEPGARESPPAGTRARPEGAGDLPRVRSTRFDTSAGGRGASLRPAALALEALAQGEQLRFLHGAERRLPLGGELDGEQLAQVPQTGAQALFAPV